MNKVLLIISMLTLISCGQKSSSSKKCTLNDQSVNCSTMNPVTDGTDSILTIDGLKNLGLIFEEVGHRTSEYQYGITCTDNIKFTNQDRLNNLDEMLNDVKIKSRTKPNAKYRVQCYQGLDKCLLNGAQMELLIMEAIKTLNYYSVLLLSKYCPNHNLTPYGVIIEN